MKCKDKKIAFSIALLTSLGSATVAVGQTGAGVEAATIYRDSFGVPHIYGNSAEALFYAGGYALMQDRMAEFDRSRRAALGRMAELDASFVESDKRERRSALSPAETQAMFDALPAEHQRLMKAQIAGINRAVDEAVADPKNKMPYEFGVLWKVQPERWTIHDYVSTFARHRQWAVSNSAELRNMDFYAWLVGKFGEAQARIIFDDVLPLDDPDAIPLNPSKAPSPASLSGLVVAANHAAPAEAAPRRFEQVDYLRLDGSAVQAPGTQIAMVYDLRIPSESRSVLVAPQRSASGRVLMMQATSDGPQIRYVGAGFDAYGYTRQGGGPLVMGRGTGHGWIQNVGMDDQVDTYAERLNPENRYQYWYQGAWRDMDRRNEVIKVNGGDDVVIEIAATIHGPVVRWDEKNQRAYTERNALRTGELSDWVCYVEWMRAKDFAAFEQIMPTCTGSATINYGGEDGTIASWHVGRRPIRVGDIDPRLPTPGTGEYEWQGWVPYQDWSKFKNPTEGFFHAWNTRPNAAVPYRDNSRWGATARNYLAYDLMRPLSKVTMEQFKEVNRKLGNGWGGVDQSTINAKFFVPYLRRAVAGDARLEQAVETMASWNAIREDLDGDGYYDSPGLPLMTHWLEIAREEIVADDLGEWEPRTGAYRNDILHRAIQGSDAGLPMRYDWFNGQDRNMVLRRTVARAVDAVTKDYGSSDSSKWRMPIYWRYYDVEQIDKNPDKPAFRRSAVSDEFSGWSLTVAARLGIMPFAVPHNGSERWNGIMEISPDGGVMMDVSPKGGQNQFISLDGKATAHIGDQLMRHATFDLKTVPMSLADLEAQQESRITIDVPNID